jgi:hypothetical protein
MNKTKTIEIVVRGGVVQEVSNIPEGVCVLVRDYDIEGVPTEKLDTDVNGDRCIESHWKRGDSCIT